MRGSKDDLPVTFDSEDITVQEGEWGEMHASVETYHKGLDITPLLNGLPDNLDQCPHWGYIIKGEYRARYKDGREEVFRSGDAYYVEPGHTTLVEAGTELVEFSPKEPLRETMEAVARNMATSTRATALGGLKRCC